MGKHSAYCGLYCGACCSMISYEKEMGEATVLELPADENELPCQGCDSEYQKHCEFVICNQKHGSENCAFCGDFPCAMITKFKDDEWEHHEVILDNLNRIKEIGTEAWLTEQREYWKCPSCGCRTQWYQKKCIRCGDRIENYK